MAQINLHTKQKQAHRHREQICSWQGMGRREKDRLGLAVGRCKLLHLELINKKVLMYNTENCLIYSISCDKP